jgi:hypothetical protein
MRLQLGLGLPPNAGGGVGAGGGGAGVELREDGFRELREDGGLELREISPDGGIHTVPEDEDSDGDAEGLDVGTIIYDGGFTGAPTIGNNGNGKKISGDSTNFAKMLYSIGVPVAGATYTMTYDPDFSAMTQQGKLAMVGFGFKQGKQYHITGLRGDGSSGLNAYKAYGSDFSRLAATSFEDGGVAANGTQAGPNWLQIAINAAGTTYTLRTSADGETWDDEFTDDLPDPIDAATDATDFGIAVYFDSTDKGLFEVDITLWTQGDTVAGGALTLTYQSASSSLGVKSSWAAGTLAIGTASEGRLVIAVAASDTSPSSSATITSLVVGGVSLTQRAYSGTIRHIDIWAGIVPTGADAAVTVTYSNNQNRHFVALYSLTGYTDIVPYSTDTYDGLASSNGPLSLAHPADSVAIVGTLLLGDATASTWANSVTKDGFMYRSADTSMMWGSKVLVGADTLTTDPSDTLATSRTVGAIWA